MKITKSPHATGNEAYGALMRGYRERAGLSLRGLGNQCGVTAPTIWDIEKGNRLPSAALFERMSKALELDDADRQALAEEDKRILARAVQALVTRDPAAARALLTHTKRFA